MIKSIDTQHMDKVIRPNIHELRQAYERGENIAQLLTRQLPALPRQEVIELAYDLQAGSYTKIAISDPELLKRYALELSELCNDHLADHDIILDCGAGELTTLSALSQHLPSSSQLLACDISLSRLRVGRRFSERFMRGDLADHLKLFVADMARMPLTDRSVDVALTVHALEPNYGREQDLLKELLRITRRTLILFEPSWENANDEVRTRMSRHGYVRDLPRHIKDAGGHLVTVKPLPHPLNPMNPTYCYVVEPVDRGKQPKLSEQVYQCPRSGNPLQRHDGYWWSEKGGWAYPDIDDISCLRMKHGVLMSHA
jgi:hypothetical protein